MTIVRGYKTELQLNNTQRTFCLKSAGVARFAYNWGLRIKIDEYQKTGKSLNAIELNRRLNALKKMEFPWMYDVSKCAPQEALRDLDRTFQHFFRRVKNGEKPGFPKFKSRKRGISSFRLTGSIRVKSNQIRLPRLGWLKLKEKDYLPTDKKIFSATVSEKAGHWFVSLQVEEALDPPELPPRACGVDVGIHQLATLDDGTVFENPKAFSLLERKLQRSQRWVSRNRPVSLNPNNG
jgi:putative transposase